MEGSIDVGREGFSLETGKLQSREAGVQCGRERPSPDFSPFT